MTLTPYMVFVENNTQTLLTNVTFTSNEWMAITQQFNTELTNAMTVGVILGFVVGILALSAGTWWKNRGNS